MSRLHFMPFCLHVEFLHLNVILSVIVFKFVYLKQEKKYQLKFYYTYEIDTNVDATLLRFNTVLVHKRNLSSKHSFSEILFTLKKRKLSSKQCFSKIVFTLQSLPFRLSVQGAMLDISILFMLFFLNLEMPIINCALFCGSELMLSYFYLYE